MNRPASSELKTQQIAIIGGGIASFLLADHLIKKSPEVLITLFCEDDKISTKGSSNKQGAIYPLLQAKRTLLAEFYATAYEYAITYFKNRLPNKELVNHQWCGVLQQAVVPEMADKFSFITKNWSPIVTELSAQQSSEVANLELPYPSLFYPDGGWLNPVELCHWLSSQLTQTGQLKIKTNCKVTDLTRNGSRWSLIAENTQAVTTDNVLVDNGHYDAVAICAGINSGMLPQTTVLPLEYVLGQVSSFTENKKVNNLKTVLCHQGYITPSTQTPLNSAEQGNSYKEKNQHFQSFGATFVKQQCRPELIDIRPSSKADAKNITQIASTYPLQPWAQEVSVNDINHNNAAVRATTPDHLPLVGEVMDWSWVEHYIDKNNGQLKRSDKLQGDFVNPSSGLFCLTGLGARGLTSAPLCAELLSDLILQSTLHSKMQMGVQSIEPSNNALINNAHKSTLKSAQPIKDSINNYILRYQGNNQSATAIQDTVMPMRFQIREYKKNKGRPL